MAAPQLSEMPGDVLSPSSASRYLSCGAKYYFGKIERLPDPPSGALALGSSVHAALSVNFDQKIETHEDLETEGVVSLFRAAWALKVKGDFPERFGRPSLPAEFRGDESPTELQAMGEALVRKYMDEAAPAIEPAAVELPVSGMIGGVAVRGFVDLLDVNGQIIDIKTAARKPSEVSFDYRLQVASYAQLTPRSTGKARVDTLTKTKTPALVEQSITIDQDDLAATEKLYPLVQRSIRGQHFVPARSSHLCSRRYCSFWRACEREFGGRVTE